MAPELNIEVVASSAAELDFRWYEDIREELLLRALEGSWRVLDVGCGDGKVLLSLSQVIGRGLGVDILAEDVKRACARASDEGIRNVAFSRADATALPVSDDSHDAVLCLGDVLSSGNLYRRWRRALREMYRALRPEGRAVFHCMNWAWEYRTGLRWTFFKRDSDVGFAFVRVRRTAAGVETARTYRVVEGTPLDEWLSEQEWPASPSGGRTALTVLEKEPVPEEWLCDLERSRLRNFTASGLARALRSAGFDDVWVTPFGATYDIACGADLLETLEPVRRRLAQAEAQVLWTQRTGSGPWLFATARKPRST